MKLRHAILFSSGSIICTLILASISSSAFPESSANQRAFEFTYTARIAKLPYNSAMLRLWVPLPQSDRYQTISSLRIDSPLHYAREREPQYGNEYIYLEAPAAKVQQPLELQIRFHADRREHLVELKPASTATAGADVSQALLARFLEPDHLVPLNGVIADLSRQATEGVTEPLEKAHKIYEYVVSTMRYDKSGTGWGHGDAVWACSSKYGNCTDFHSLFIGMARSAGIPGRFEIGFPLPADKHEGTIPGYHCWAEFYVRPYGWIPIDASEAWKHPPQREYYFGAHDSNRVQFTLGRDIRLKPAQQSEPLNYFIYPYAELDGKPFAVSYEFSFKDDVENASRSTGD